MTAKAKRGQAWKDPVLAEASERFPEAFVRYGVRPAALKIRIEQDLKRFMVAYSTNRIRKSLQTYCETRWYLEAVARGGERVDLFGRPAGAIDDRARVLALDRLMAKAPPAGDAGAGHGPRRRLAHKGAASLELRLSIARTKGFRV